MNGVPRRRALLGLLAGALALGGCGGSGAAGSGRTEAGPLIVSAAASLESAFQRYGAQLARTPQGTPRFSFAGSDALAAQIREGIRPDVFASANMALPRALHAQGLVEAPVTFIANRLVLAVPAGARSPESLAAAGAPGVKIAIGSPTVPIGAYTRKVLARLPAGLRGAVLAKVRDEEPDVSGIVGKLSEGAVDAGFTYASDVRAAGGRLRAIALPATLQPLVAYGVAIVRGTARPARARAFIAGLLRGQGRQDLLRAGFLAPARR